MLFISESVFSCSGCCRNCTGHSNDHEEAGNANECSEKSVVLNDCGEEPVTVNNEPESIEDVLKRFTGFKPFNILTSSETSSDKTEEFTDNLGKAIVPASLTKELAHPSKNLSHDVLKPNSDCFLEVSEPNSRSNISDSVEENTLLKKSTKKEATLLLLGPLNMHSSYSGKQTLFKGQIRRSATEYKLSHKAPTSKEEISRLRKAEFEEGRRGKLKKSLTSNAIFKTSETTECAASGRRRLPAAPSQDNDVAQSAKGSIFTLHLKKKLNVTKAKEMH